MTKPRKHGAFYPFNVALYAAKHEGSEPDWR